MRMRNPKASPVHTPLLSAQPSSAARLTRQHSRAQHQAPAGTGTDSPGAALQARAEARQQAAQAREAQRKGLKAYIAGQRRQVSSCRPEELWHEAVSCTVYMSTTGWPGQHACFVRRAWCSSEQKALPMATGSDKRAELRRWRHQSSSRPHRVLG